MMAALAAAIMLAAAGCGGNRAAGDGPEAADSTAAAEERLAEYRAALAEERPLHGVQKREAGEGTRAAFVLWRDDLSDPPSDVVVFLHAWSPLMSAPAVYGEWIGHLAAQGSAIIFPTYLGVDTRSSEAPDNVLAGVATGLDALDSEPDSLVAAGYTTGGALAFDYAAGAADSGLPRPDAVFAVYPGRNPSGIIPAVDPAGIAPRTQIAVLAGEGNPVIDGEAQARHLLRTAKSVPREHRRYIEVDPVAHPLESNARTRRAIWRPLDRLIEAARRRAGERR